MKHCIIRGIIAAALALIAGQTAQAQYGYAHLTTKQLKAESAANPGTVLLNYNRPYMDGRRLYDADMKAILSGEQYTEWHRYDRLYKKTMSVTATLAICGTATGVLMKAAVMGDFFPESIAGKVDNAGTAAIAGGIASVFIGAPLYIVSLRHMGHAVSCYNAAHAAPPAEAGVAFTGNGIGLTITF